MNPQLRSGRSTTTNSGAQKVLFTPNNKSPPPMIAPPKWQCPTKDGGVCPGGIDRWKVAGSQGCPSEGEKKVPS